MSKFDQAIIWVAYIITIFGILSIAIVLRTILSNRYKYYKMKLRRSLHNKYRDAGYSNLIREEYPGLLRQEYPEMQYSSVQVMGQRLMATEVILPEVELRRKSILERDYPEVTRYRTLIDFPQAFLPLTIVIGYRRKYGDELLTSSASIEELRWLLELGLPRDTEIVDDRVFITEKIETLREKFGKKNILVIGSPIDNYLSNIVNSTALFRFNISQNDQESISVLARSGVNGNDIDSGEVKNVISKLENQSRIKELERKIIASGFIDPTLGKRQAIQLRPGTDYAVVSLCRNPYTHSQSTEFVSILAAGLHLLGAASAVRSLARPNILFSECPLGGVLEVKQSKNVIQTTDKFIQSDAIWLTEPYEKPEALVNTFLYKKEQRGEIFELQESEIEENINFIRQIRFGGFLSSEGIKGGFEIKKSELPGIEISEEKSELFHKFEEIKNNLIQISGCKIQTGLSPKEIDYIIEYICKIFTNINKSRRNIRNMKKQLRNEYPEKTMSVKTFLFSKYPVTNHLFEMFVKATDYTTTAERMMSQRTWLTEKGHNGDDHPVTNVSFRDALAFCKWAGVRLPTSVEFECAVRGPENRLFPWGDEWQSNMCNDMFWVMDLGTSAVTKFKNGVSRNGIYDLCGNVFEWLDSVRKMPNGEKMQPGLEFLAGGSFDSVSVLRGNASTRMFAQIDSFGNNVGFRFAADIEYIN